MAFGIANVITQVGRAVAVDRLLSSPAGGAPCYIQIGVGATGAARTAAATDITLSTPVEARVAGAESQTTITTSGDTYQVVGIVTASAARNVDEAGLFTASTGGTLFFSATFAPIALNPGDQLQLTFRTQVA